MTDRYSIFQTDLEIDTSSPETNTPAKRSMFGFLGQVVEGTGIVALTLGLAIITLTTAARADSLFEAGANVATPTGPLIGLTLLAVFAVMLAMVRKTWRQTTKAIETAPHRSFRID